MLGSFPRIDQDLKINAVGEYLFTFSGKRKRKYIFTKMTIPLFDEKMKGRKICFSSKDSIQNFPSGEVLQKNPFCGQLISNYQGCCV